PTAGGCLPQGAGAPRGSGEAGSPCGAVGGGARYGPKGLANLPKLGSLVVSQRFLHQERVVGETDRAVESLRVPVLQTGGQHEPIGPALAGPFLDELQQAPSHAVPTIRSRDEEVR